MKKINVLVREETSKGYGGNLILVFLDGYSKNDTYDALKDLVRGDEYVGHK